MKRFLPSMTKKLLAGLIASQLVAGCTTIPTKNQTEPNQKNAFWSDPDKIHIATEWPTDDNDLKIWDVPNLEEAYISTAPANRRDGLLVGDLEADKIDRDSIVQLANDIAEDQHGNIDSLLIAHKGRLVFESYFRGGRINLTHPQASATKTYTSLVLGRAIELGYLTMDDLDKPIVSFLDELDPTKFVEGVEEITLRQALTMRSGIRISEEQSEEFDKTPDQYLGQKLAQAVFEKSEPISQDKLNTFSYGNYSAYLVMLVVDAVVPGTAEEFVQNEFLSKLDITTYRWLSAFGLPAGGWKTSFTSRDMMKFGLLAADKGKWRGEQLIPEAYIREATSRALLTGDDDIYGGGKDVSNEGYGFFWWGADLKVGDKIFYSPNAQGGGGQFIILIDELDLVVVTTAGIRHPTSLQIVAEHVLPAFIQ